MLSIMWAYKVFVYFELLLNKRTINSDVYLQQLMKSEKAIKEKSPELSNSKGVVFYNENASFRTPLAMRKKLLELDWEVVSHPRYSPD